MLSVNINPGQTQAAGRPSVCEPQLTNTLIRLLKIDGQVIQISMLFMGGGMVTLELSRS